MRSTSERLAESSGFRSFRRKCSGNVPRRSHSMHSTHSIGRLLTISAKREGMYLPRQISALHCTALRVAEERERERERGGRGTRGKRREASRGRGGLAEIDSVDRMLRMNLAMHREKRSAICLRSPLRGAFAKTVPRYRGILFTRYFNGFNLTI